MHLYVRVCACACECLLMAGIGRSLAPRKPLSLQVWRVCPSECSIFIYAYQMPNCGVKAAFMRSLLQYGERAAQLQLKPAGGVSTNLVARQAVWDWYLVGRDSLAPSCLSAHSRCACIMHAGGWGLRVAPCALAVRLAYGGEQ